MKWSGHFSGIGWTQDRGDCEVLWFPGRRLEAFRAKAEGVKLVCAVSNDAMTEEKAEPGETAGTTGKSMPLYYVRFWPDGAQGHVCYRVCLKQTGWTAFCRDGEICGNQRDKEGTFSPENYIEGMQIFYLDSLDRLDGAAALSERKLSEYIAVRDRLFVRQAEKALLAITKSCRDESAAQVQEVRDGYLLPLRRTGAKSRSGIYEGGVADGAFRFIAGLERKKGKAVNYSCLNGYEVRPEEAEYSEETVIFGGIFISTFGHLFAECLSRLWWVVEHREVEYRIAVLGIPGQKRFSEEFFELLGISGERIWLIDRPMRFHRILVPGQSVRLLSDYKKEYMTVYDEIRSRVNPKSYDKIYLTRKHFSAEDGINEEFLEEFYRKRGYHIIAPEQFSVREQIEYMAGAREAACTQGTLSHLALFCRPGTKLTVFRRAENILQQQILIDQARQLEVTYVDATFNFMPTAHAGGVFLYGPTEHFVKYLEKNHMEFQREELEFHIEDYVYKYLMRWCRNYREVRNFHTISGWDLFDVVNNMNRVFGLPELSRKKFLTQEGTYQ